MALPVLRAQGAPCQTAAAAFSAGPVPRRRFRLGALAVGACAATLLALSCTSSQTYTSPTATPDEHSLRRRSVLSLPAAVAGVAGASLEASPALAFSKTSKEETFNVRGNPNSGIRPYVFTKPNKFRQFSNLLDPSGYVFKNTNNTDIKFTINTNADENASSIFTPEFFINDYTMKYNAATGANFTLIKGDGPAREDKTLNLKYYDFEYVVTKQTDFGFDSIKTLHFFTTFAVAPESIYILNCQCPADKWDKYKPVLQSIVDSFAVTG